MLSFLPLSPALGAELLVRALESPRNELLRTNATAPETLIHAAADDATPVIQASVTYAFTRGRMAIDMQALLSAMTEAEAEAATAKVADAAETALTRVLPQQLWKAFVSGGEAALGQLDGSAQAAPAGQGAELPAGQRLLAAGPGPAGTAGQGEGLGGLAQQYLRAAKRESSPRPKLSMSFNQKNERAIAWAKEHATELIDDLTKTTRKAIKAAIIDGFKNGNTYKKVLAAIGDENRANVIARTEAMRAANGGQREAWEQAVERSLLTKRAKRVWIATGEGACDVCDKLDGKTAPLGKNYRNEAAGEGPPAHPNCRCTEGIVD